MMARAGLIDHPKFVRYVYLMKEPIPHCWGYLECLWKTAYQRRSDLIGDEIDVELAAMYPGEQGKCVKNLVAVGFVDVKEGKYHVHDLLDHAPPYVRKAMLGKSTKGRPEGDYDSTDDEPMVDHKSTSSRSMVDQESINGSTVVGKRREEKRKRKEYSSEFELFWKAYPRGEGKPDAFKAWEKLKPDAALAAQIMKNITTRQDWLGKEPQYIPHAATYLNKQRWTDEVKTNGTAPQPTFTECDIDRLTR